MVDFKKRDTKALRTKTEPDKPSPKGTKQPAKKPTPPAKTPAKKSD